MHCRKSCDSFHTYDSYSLLGNNKDTQQQLYFYTYVASGVKLIFFVGDRIELLLVSRRCM